MGVVTLAILGNPETEESFKTVRQNSLKKLPLALDLEASLLYIWHLF